MGGLIPRISPRLLPQSQATVATGCNLESGEIRPFIASRDIDTDFRSGAETKTLFELNGTFNGWTEEAHVVLGLPRGNDANPDQLYVSRGAVAVPTVYTVDGAGVILTSRPLSTLTAPTTPPTLGAVSGTGAGTPLLRSYVTTFVTINEEEGPPSNPSTSVSMADGQTVSVSQAGPYPAGAQYVNYYRLALGSSESRYLFVKRTLVGGTILDDVPDIALGETLRSLGWGAPPSDLAGFFMHPGIFLVGYRKNALWFSEPSQFHAWKERNSLRFETDIVATGIFGNTIVVATKAYIHLVTGTVPGAMTVERLPDPYPCVSSRSMVSADRGAIFASLDGLVWVGYGGVQVITREVMTRVEWRRFFPESILGASYDGKYVGFYSRPGGLPGSLPSPRGSFIFDYMDRATGVAQKDKLVTTNSFATAVFANPGGAMFYVEPTSSTIHVLREWGNRQDGADVNSYFYTGFSWESKHFVSPHLIKFRAAKVVFTPTQVQGLVVLFKLFVGTRVIYQREVRNSQPFRLPPFSRYVEPWRVGVEFVAAPLGGPGAPFVQEIHIAPSMEDLKEGGWQ